MASGLAGRRRQADVEVSNGDHGASCHNGLHRSSFHHRVVIGLRMASTSPDRLLRLFLSSTFRDMQAERDILTRLVLPRQRAALAARNAALQEVDLRWGVTA